MADTHRATTAEIVARRARVLRLRLTGLSEPEIGEQLGVSAATVSRDLIAVQQGWAEEFGDRFNAKAEIGESVALFGVLEAAAMRELAKLEAENGSTSQKVRCLWAARGMRQAKHDLLMATGMIRHGSDMPPASNLPTAAEIRRAIHLARITPDDLVSEGERRWLDMPRPTAGPSENSTHPAEASNQPKRSGNGS
jgi:predicted transcriptional regulator